MLVFYIHAVSFICRSLVYDVYLFNVFIAGDRDSGCVATLSRQRL